MRLTTILLTLLLLCLIVGCQTEQFPNGNSNKPQLTIAAAANVEPALTEIGKVFETETGIKTVFSFGATGSLAKQIENGAPFDLFISADVKTVDQLISKGEIVAESKRRYARGTLVVWWPTDAKVVPATFADVVKPEFKKIALAKPDLAPYGAAAKESLEAIKLWQAVESRVIYSENVNAALQYAKTGNVDLAFIPLSLVKTGENYLVVDEKLHQPIDQALGILKRSKAQELAKRFDTFLNSDKGHAMLEKYGYQILKD